MKVFLYVIVKKNWEYTILSEIIEAFGIPQKKSPTLL